MPRIRSTRRTSAIALAYVLGNLACVILGVAMFASAQPDDKQSDAGAGLGEPLGVSILASGVVGLVSFGYVLLSERTRERILVLHEFGVEDYFDTNATSLKGVYGDHFNDGHKSIDIIGTGLNKFRRDFFVKGKLEWLGTREVRILLVDPEYPDPVYSYAVQRDLEENDRAGTIGSNVEGWKQALADAADIPGANIQIRLYTCLPTLTMVRVGNRIFWAPYMMHRGASSTPTMMVRRGGHLFEVLEQHFDTIWADDKLSRPMA